MSVCFCGRTAVVELVVHPLEGSGLSGEGKFKLCQHHAQMEKYPERYGGEQKAVREAAKVGEMLTQALKAVVP